MGRVKSPFYKIRVANVKSPRDGKFIENIGTYDPMMKTKNKYDKVKIKKDLLIKWLENGAQISDSVLKKLDKSVIEEMPTTVKTRLKKQLHKIIHKGTNENIKSKILNDTKVDENNKV